MSIIVTMTDTPFMTIPPDILRAHIWPRLDARDVAVMACVSSELRSLVSTDEKLWKDISIKAWPSIDHPAIQRIISSFHFRHYSFFRDASAYPVPDTAAIQKHRNIHHGRCDFGSELLISSIDIKYNGDPVYSRCSSFKDASRSLLVLDDDPDKYIIPYCNVLVRDPVMFEAETTESRVAKSLTLSWVVIDPTSNRAINLSSSRPVDHAICLESATGSEMICISYATFFWAATTGAAADVASNDSMGLVHCLIQVGCFWKDHELRVKKVWMRMCDLDSRVLDGVESLAIVRAALEGGRRGKTKMEAELYQQYVNLRAMRVQEQQRKQEKRDKRDDTVLRYSCLLFIFSPFIITAVSLIVS